MKNTQKQIELVTTLLRAQTTLSLATTGEAGEACVAPVFYIADKELSLYWLSSESSLHSMNLKRAPSAAGTVYRNAENWREIRGVQLRGSVSKVTDPERRAALIEAFCARFKLGTVLRLAIHQSVLYSLQPDSFRYIDNAKGFGFKFELTRRSEGWTLT